MPAIQCPDLQSVLDEQHKKLREGVSQTERIEIMKDIYMNLVLLLGKVGACHRKNLVHQDLKPEQILMVPFEGGLRASWPISTGPSSRARNRCRASEPRCTSAPSTCSASPAPVPRMCSPWASSSFRALGLGWFPLLTREELNGFLTPEETNELVKRCEVKHKLAAIWDEELPGMPFDREALNKIQEALVQTMRANPADRLTTQELWEVMKNNNPLSDAVEPPPPPTTWFRLRPIADPESDDFITVNGQPGATVALERRAMKNVFRLMADSEGNPTYRYFSKTSPNLVFVREGDVWQVSVPEDCNNKFVLENRTARRWTWEPPPCPWRSEPSCTCSRR
jgi:serine/threonine protein kinase